MRTMEDMVRVTSWVLLLVLFMCGCSAMSGGQAIASHEGGKDLVLTQAPADGTYELYDTYLDRRPKLVVSLMKGSRIGFRSTETGVVAVGGKREMPLNEGYYIWKKRK